MITYLKKIKNEEINDHSISEFQEPIITGKMLENEVVQLSNNY